MTDDNNNNKAEYVGYIIKALHDSVCPTLTYKFFHSQLVSEEFNLLIDTYLQALLVKEDKDLVASMESLMLKRLSTTPVIEHKMHEAKYRIETRCEYDKKEETKGKKIPPSQLHLKVYHQRPWIGAHREYEYAHSTFSGFPETADELLKDIEQSNGENFYVFLGCDITSLTNDKISCIKDSHSWIYPYSDITKHVDMTQHAVHGLVIVYPKNK